VKLAVFHDFLRTMGGGERVALVLARHFRADLIATDCDPQLPTRAGYDGVRVLDLGALHRRPPFKQLEAARKFARARLAGYDFHILLGNWATYAAARHHPNLYYCLTPTRMLFDQRDAILGQLGPVLRLPARIWIRTQRSRDRRAVGHCDRVVSLSETVRRRVHTFYGRESEVVYPPVDTSRFRFEEVGDTWLAVTRLYPEKRVHLLLDTFRRLPDQRLTVVGGYTRGDRTERYVAGLRPPENVRLLGEVSETDLLRLYARCRGVLAMAIDEDFGLTPVEAMAAGKCVLATDEGGHRETVVNGRTGFLLPATADAFASRIRSLDEATLRSMREACRDRARQFDVAVFLRKMETVLKG
jgi:glycosyltransferase involved in cell wall biosynthesis